MAVGFTALANVLLLATFLFREWLKPETRLFALAALTIVWLLARWQSRAQRRASLTVEDDLQLPEGEAELLPTERDVLFGEAQGHYLRNDWVATEQLLLRLLKQDARDVESRLMLATLWRHQGRLAEATRQLDRLQRLEAAENWQHEIAAERAAISAANHPAAKDSNEPLETNEIREATDVSTAPPEGAEVTEDSSVEDPVEDPVEDDPVDDDSAEDSAEDSFEDDDNRLAA